MHHCGRLNLGHEGGGGLLHCLSSSVGLRLRRRQDVGLGPRLGRGQGVLDDLGLVNDLRRDPYPGGGDHLNSGDNLGLQLGY